MVTEKEAETDVFKRRNLNTANLLPQGHHGEMKVAGNRLAVACDAETKDDAYTRVTALAARFARLISMKTGQHFTAVFEGLDSVPGEAGQGIFAPFVLTWWVETYNETSFPADIEASGLSCSLNDQVLDRALTYFQRGLFYRRVAWRLVHPLSQDAGFTVSEATLNFHHAVKTVLGDDRNGRRSQALGVERDLRKRIERLYRRRSTGGVAHPTLDAAALQRLRDTVYESQEIARKVIEAYIDALLRGDTLPPVIKSRR